MGQQLNVARISWFLGSALALGIFVIPSPGFAQKVSTKTKWNYYTITGSTSRELKAAMKRKGPDGYWAYARWYIRWTGDCRVSLSLDYTMPRWKGRDKAPQKLRTNWDKMIKNLKAHEEVHGSHGIRAADEIVKAKCRNAHAIIAKWAKEDKKFDRVTQHGRKQGVVLP